MAGLNEKFLEYYNRPTPEKYKKQIGRYSASQIYQIKRGFLNVDNYFDDDKKDMGAIKNIFRGCACEDYLEKMLVEMGVELVKREGDETKQVKYELSIDDYVLVIKPDFIFKGRSFVFETKAPNKINMEIPLWYKYQCECEHRATNKTVYLVKINIYADNDLPLFIACPYTPSDKMWTDIKKILTKFNKQLKEKYGE